MTIWKYTIPLDKSLCIAMPKRAKILCVKLQSGSPQLWALVDEYNPLVERLFHLVGTGCDLPDDEEMLAYIDTILLDNDSLVLHMFESMRSAGYHPRIQ
jgi:hypothetical protein